MKKVSGVKRILLVEDNEDMLRIISRLLRGMGYEVQTAASAKEAIRIGTEQEFDLLLSDIGLPDGTGWEVMEALKQKGPVRGVALSGFGQDDDFLRSRQAGFETHLVKPINFAALQRAIEKPGNTTAA